MINPCKDCTDRWINDNKTCHSICEKYMKYKEERDIIRDNRNKYYASRRYR